MGKALFYETCIVRLVTALGGYLSFGDVTYEEGQIRFSKMQLFPLQTGQFLGYLVDLARKAVVVPEKKLEYFKKLTRELLQERETTPRQKARFVGLVVSFIKAIVPAKLYIRRMFKCITGEVKWDAAYETPEEERQVMERWVNHVDEWNGRRWVKRPVVLTLAGDASINIGAAYEVRKTLSDGMFKHPIIITMEPAIAGRGSTVREANICKRAVEVALQQEPERLRNSTVEYIGDNEGMCSTLNNWWARDPWLAAELEQLYELCMRAASISEPSGKKT